MTGAELPVLAPPSAVVWHEWLEAEHGASAGVWLRIARKHAAQAGPSYREALDVALCFGWIDGQKRPLDDDCWLQRFTPRQPRSRWSKINTERAEELASAGRMRPAGLREVERAKADGRWADAYAGPRAAEVPADLRAALQANPAAAEFFGSVSSANRYAILYRVAAVKRAETRARKIAQFVQMLAERKTLHP